MACTSPRDSAPRAGPQLRNAPGAG
jgi:hypothetical protein